MPGRLWLTLARKWCTNGSGSAGKNPLKSFVSLASNTALVTGIYCSGDVAQRVFLQKKPADPQSSKNLAILTCTCIGPLYHFWYRALERRIPGSSLRAVCVKLCLDQVVMGTLGLCIFFVGLDFLERKADVFEDLRNKGVKTYILNSLYYIPAQSANFALVPSKWWPATVSLMDFFWMVILCYIKTT